MSEISPLSSASGTIRSGWLRTGLILASALLLLWSLVQVSLEQLWQMLRAIPLGGLGFWLVFNLAILVLMAGRWWLILRNLGYPLPYLVLARYRLSAFAVSYLTPGPQFGGEPVQVWLLQRRHQLPLAAGTASVSLDKLLELIANFSFLVFGMAVALAGNWLPGLSTPAALLAATGLLLLPSTYLILMLAGVRPLGAVLDRLPDSLAEHSILRGVRQVECQMSHFCVESPWVILRATLLSGLVWLALIAEYWLATRLLGLQLNLVQVLSALVAARLAFLTPLPGGVGALEASQVLALEALGFSGSYGLGLSLIMRGRDLLFAAVGLQDVLNLIGWGNLAALWRRQSPPL